jgi:hypothetical protein
VKVSDGVYTYTFKTKLPEGYKPDEAHTIGMYFTRVLSSIGWGTSTRTSG